jgi:hypothetical protein
MEEVVKCTLARARRLAQAGMQAVFCVEGDLLPEKAETAEGRTQIRTAAMEELLALYEEGDELGNELLEGAVVTRVESEQMFGQLRKLRSSAACITVDMLHLLLHKLRENGYSYCVFPYGSDCFFNHTAVTPLFDKPGTKGEWRMPGIYKAKHRYNCIKRVPVTKLPEFWRLSCMLHGPG